MRKLLAVLVGVLALTATICSAPARGATPTPNKVCPDWKLRSIVTAWQEPAEGSKVVSASKVVLTKPTGGGTEFATYDAGLTFDSPVTITVFYSLDEDADYAA